MLNDGGALFRNGSLRHQCEFFLRSSISKYEITFQIVMPESWGCYFLPAAEGNEDIDCLNFANEC